MIEFSQKKFTRKRGGILNFNDANERQDHGRFVRGTSVTFGERNGLLFLAYLSRLQVLFQP